MLKVYQTHLAQRLKKIMLNSEHEIYPAYKC